MYSILKRVIAIKLLFAVLMLSAMPELAAGAERKLILPQSEVTGIKPVLPVRPRWPRPGEVFLTNTECTNAGGTINTTSSTCTNAGQFTCVTYDINGQPHQSCIDNK